MKRTIILSTGIFLLFLSNAFPQEVKNEPFRKNQIGIQFNPYINDQFFDFLYINTISSLRYGHRITKNITTGLEFACSFPVNIGSGQNFQDFNYFSYRIGPVARYSILAERRVQLFSEVSPYFAHYYKESTSSTDPSPIISGKFGYYAAPGLSIYSKNKRISFDLFYKFSNIRFINGKKYVFSYKVNFNF
ncbi:MAG: hypothetical protein U5K32_06355 [Bacteroidales bacterium]|nr:hypothetical protein [Bacteroidales bacterium]